MDGYVSAFSIQVILNVIVEQVMNQVDTLGLSVFFDEYQFFEYLDLLIHVYFTANDGV